MLSREQVEKVSKLARLKLSEQELDTFCSQLSSVLEYFEMIEQVNTDGVEPLVTPIDLPVAYRNDQVRESRGDNEKWLRSAPEKAGRLYKVPPVV